MRFRMTALLRIGLAACLVLVAGRPVAGEGAEGAGARNPAAGTARFPTSRERGNPTYAPMTGSSTSWWLVPLGVLLAGGAWAGLSLSARKAGSARTSPGVALEVVGRVAVGPRQAVCLVKVGGQVLIIGTGPQGPPTLMGELEQPSPEEAAP